MQVQSETSETGEQSKKVSAQPNLVLSQKDYVPTPFQATQWEIVGVRIEERSFVPMELSVLRTHVAEADPMFEDFGGSVTAGVEALRHARGNEMFIPKDQEEQAPVIDEAVLEQVRQAAFDEGRQQGLQEGEESAKTLIEERFGKLQEQLRSLNEGIKSSLDGNFARLEKSALQLALTIARKILSTTAEIKPEYIYDVIRHAMKSAGAGKPIRIRVSNEDYEFLTVIGLPDDLSSEENTVNYVADENIKSGCVVESDFGEIDLQLDRMWEQVRENLYEVSK